MTGNLLSVICSPADVIHIERTKCFAYTSLLFEGVAKSHVRAARERRRECPGAPRASADRSPLFSCLASLNINGKQLRSGYTDTNCFLAACH